jgi:hypothetical protein
MAEEENEKAAKSGGKPQLTPEQEAEAAAKKAARADAKAKGGKGGGKKGAAAPAEVAMERVKRAEPARLRKLYDTEVRGKLIEEFSVRRCRTRSSSTAPSKSSAPSPASARS